MSKLQGVEFKKQIISTEYKQVSEQAFKVKFEAKKKSSVDVNDTRTPTERIADQVTPLHK